MTLLSIVATKKFVSLMGDGKGISTKGGKDFENIKKVHKVNDKIIIGFAGDNSVNEVVIRKIETLNTENAEKLSENLYSIFGNGKLKRDINILIGGKDSKGEIYFSVFNNESTFLPEYRPKNREPLFVCNPTPYRSEQLSMAILNKILVEEIKGNGNLPPKNCISAQKRFNEEIVKMGIDPTVNSNTLYEIIEL